jgi:peptidoglycan/xylan/chitin deacetylase (PgdA/CDA1 family)
MCAEKRVFLSVDVEQDCPPFLSTWRGVEEGMPRLLDLFRDERIRSTFFTTGQVAERYPQHVARVLWEGHELGCHGHSHQRFDQISRGGAEQELKQASHTLRLLGAPVESFRAPNLQFPDSYLPLLAELGYRLDSSLATYKPPYAKGISVVNGITRLPVTATSSVLRLPLPLARRIVCRAPEPVLFVHPWEFVDMSKTGIRLDCRFNTGEGAVTSLTALIRWFKAEGYRFMTLREGFLSGEAQSLNGQGAATAPAG